MRKFILSILLASAAASPALAQDHGRWHQENADNNNQPEAHEQRQQAHEQRGNGDAARVQQQQQPQQQAPRFEMHQQQQQQQAGEQGRGGWNRQRFDGGQQNAVQQQVVEQQQQQQVRRHFGYRGGFNGQEQQVQQAPVQRNQTDGSWSRDRGSWSHNRDGDFRQRPVDQQQQQARSGTWSGSNWNPNNNTRYSGNWDRNWRNDHHYDWRNYRNNHRSVFHLGVYFDPFGYGYRPFDIGYRLQPYYYQQQYWIDPGMYELPYPPPGTMWVRYWNDALLVDMYSGQVVDVIRDFFW